MKKSAHLSLCGKYRYTLERVWDDTRPSIIWVMLNPSNADAEIDDRTIRRCIHFTQQAGCGSLLVVNLFALRTPYPRELWQASDPIGPENDAIIERVFLNKPSHTLTIAAWGKLSNQIQRSRVNQILKLLQGVEIRALRELAGGDPGHPLYVPKDAAAVRWPRIIPSSLE